MFLSARHVRSRFEGKYSVNGRNTVDIPRVRLSHVGVCRQASPPQTPHLFFMHDHDLHFFKYLYPAILVLFSPYNTS